MLFEIAQREELMNLRRVNVEYRIEIDRQRETIATFRERLATAIVERAAALDALLLMLRARRD